MCVLRQDLAAEPAAEGEPWSSTTRFEPDGAASVGGVSLMRIAADHGTPAYVLDESDVRRRCRAYRAALPDAEIAYSAKAFLCRAMVGWVHEEGLSLNVCSGGELTFALAAGFPAERIIFHGTAKTPQEIHTAIEVGVGRIVVDNAAEINRLAALVPPGRRQKILLRVIPDIEAGALEAAGEQRFGLSIATGAAGQAVARVLGQPRLELAGLHCHLGSQICEAQPYERVARTLIEQMVRIRDAHGVVLPELDLGGGHGIAYLESEHGLDPRRYAAAITAAVAQRCAGLGLPVPRLVVEPGRAISGPAGLTLYRVISIKRGMTHIYAAVDGGMSDNPHPSPYGSGHTARMIGRRSTAGTREMTVIGHHSAAEDVIAQGVELPADLRPGDLIVVAATGAYHHSMASTYTMTARPPVVAVADGRARLVVRREEPEDLMRREVGL
ncbi:diaminopimelate decarboxylase [Microtetraspora glauca]|uniref:Diaminopimelate decarboxylase n=1 Tax=Microtetraspora glauca TaxID=1996 RepID=A0ABV3GSA1_MICGL